MDHSPNKAYARYVSSLNRGASCGHVVFVLFNVYKGPVPGTSYLHNTHDPDGKPRRSYAQYRLPVFQEFTLRSLANQTSDNFVVGFLYEKSTVWKAGQLQSVEAEASRRLAVPFELVPIDAIDFTRNYRSGFWARRPAEERAVVHHVDPDKPLLVTYLDGDDLLHEEYVARIQKQKVDPHTQVICCPHGYMYHARRGAIRPWWRPNPKVQPPFFTLRYPTAKMFLEGRRWDGGPGRHLYVAQKLRSVSTGGRLWAQTCHGGNDSTGYATPPASPDLPSDLAAETLRAMGMGQQ